MLHAAVHRMPKQPGFENSSFSEPFLYICMYIHSTRKISKRCFKGSLVASMFVPPMPSCEKDHLLRVGGDLCAHVCLIMLTSNEQAQVQTGCVLLVEGFLSEAQES